PAAIGDIKGVRVLRVDRDRVHALRGKRGLNTAPVRAGVTAPEQPATSRTGVDDTRALRAHRERVHPEAFGRCDLLEGPGSAAVWGLEDPAERPGVERRRASRGELERADHGVNQARVDRRPGLPSVDALDDVVSRTVERLRVLPIDGEQAEAETGLGSDRLP